MVTPLRPAAAAGRTELWYSSKESAIGPSLAGTDSAYLPTELWVIELAAARIASAIPVVFFPSLPAVAIVLLKSGVVAISGSAGHTLLGS